MLFRSWWLPIGCTCKCVYKNRYRKHKTVHMQRKFNAVMVPGRLTNRRTHSKTEIYTGVQNHYTIYTAKINSKAGCPSCVSFSPNSQEAKARIVEVSTRRLCWKFQGPIKRNCISSSWCAWMCVGGMGQRRTTVQKENAFLVVTHTPTSCSYKGHLFAGHPCSESGFTCQAQEQLLSKVVLSWNNSYSVRLKILTIRALTIVLQKKNGQKALYLWQ